MGFANVCFQVCSSCLPAGNVFDSLNGIVFEWALLSDTDADEGGIVDAHNVLR